jgi:hypothetical protein
MMVVRTPYYYYSIAAEWHVITRTLPHFTRLNEEKMRRSENVELEPANYHLRNFSHFSSRGDKSDEKARAGPVYIERGFCEKMILGCDLL